LNVTSADLDPSDETYFSKRYMFYENGFGGKKKYVFDTEHDLKAVFYTKSEGTIHEILIKNVTDIAQSDRYRNVTDFKVVFEPELSLKGYIEVNKANAKITESFMESVQKKTPIEDKVDEEATETEQETTDSESSDESPKNSTKPVSYNITFEQVPKNRTNTRKLRYEEVFHGHQPMTEEQRLNATAHLVDLVVRDKTILETMKAKNDFEALIYSTREWVSDEDNQVYSTSEVIDELIQNLTTNEDWLYEDGFDETLEVYQDRIHKINSTIAPMKYRKEEHAIRAEILPITEKMLGNITNEIDAFYVQFPWTDKKKIDFLKELAVNGTQWFLDASAEQDTLALNEDPVLTSNEIKNNILSIHFYMDKWSKIRMPRDWLKKQREAKAKNGTDSSTNSTEDIYFDITDAMDSTDNIENSEDLRQNVTNEDFSESDENIKEDL